MTRLIIMLIVLLLAGSAGAEDMDYYPPPGPDGRIPAVEYEWSTDGGETWHSSIWFQQEKPVMVRPRVADKPAPIPMPGSFQIEDSIQNMFEERLKKAMEKGVLVPAPIKTWTYMTVPTEMLEGMLNDGWELVAIYQDRSSPHPEFHFTKAIVRREKNSLAPRPQLLPKNRDLG